MKVKNMGEIGGSLDLFGIESNEKSFLNVGVGTYSYNIKDKVGIGAEVKKTMLNVNFRTGEVETFKKGGLEFAQEVSIETKKASGFGFKFFGFKLKLSYDPTIN